MNNIEIDRNFIQAYEGKPGYMKKTPQEDIQEIRDYWGDEKLFSSLGFRRHEVKYIDKKS